jgi:monofunctional biosynthetic peptidoglycan transglycosylase
MKLALRLFALVVAAGLSLQLFFVGRVALMAVVNPQSTSFQRSEAWRLANLTTPLRWRQQWVPYANLPDALKRAVIASEDDGFAQHDGVDWDAIEKAWQKNAKAEERALKQGQWPATRQAPVRPAAAAPKVVGGSTITQQLAKNLLLSGERTLLRKGQELVLTLRWRPCWTSSASWRSTSTAWSGARACSARRRPHSTTTARAPCG